ncbi:Oidioi.mRNA.OKI2018_I69.chrUn_7.g17241.t1.cds [Oikopleura dioica]|uniref:Oidioi.mRNA.OKI2018_I69.chrUn_7.g17241.t1.c ds n=1 Tax=Oikopleura dioica TaxID=34765 RepID=A0ABN7TFG9_OIKDI|nr:Oidioi.mRNA.OKI2018_I69.chrUn_7.g17241.t1.cds [Oikopleura dioica]
MKNINKQEFVNLNSSVSGADSLPGDLSDIINSFDIGEMMDRVADFDLNRECGKMNSIEDGVACLEKGIGHIVDLSAEGIIDQIDIVNQMKDVFGVWVTNSASEMERRKRRLVLPPKEALLPAERDRLKMPISSARWRTRSETWEVLEAKRRIERI